MLDMSLFSAALLAVLLGCGIAVLIVRYRRTADHSGLEAEHVGIGALRGARRRALAAIGSSAVVLVSMMILGLSVPPLLGVPVLLAAPVSAAVGLLLYSFTPPARHVVAPSEVRRASLVPRQVKSYVSGRLAVPPLLALVLLVVFVVIAGLTATTDDLGLSRAIAFSSTDTTSSASPYAGWFYGLPLLGTCVVLVAVTILTMRRISAVPAFPDPVLTGLDAAWRRESMRVVSAIAVFALALPFGGAAAISGRAILSAALPSSNAAWSVLGIAFVVLGLVSLIASGVSFILATRHALALPRESMRTAELRQ